MKNSSRPALCIADESRLLPEFQTVQALFEAKGRGGRCTILPAAVTSLTSNAPPRKGGYPVPSWWQDAGSVFHRPLELFRLKNAYYLPKLGAIISADGEVMLRSFAEAKYLYGSL